MAVAPCQLVLFFQITYGPDTTDSAVDPTNKRSEQLDQKGSYKLDWIVRFGALGRGSQSER